MAATPLAISATTFECAISKTGRRRRSVPSAVGIKLTNGMTLLRNIQDAAVGADVPISTVLRKAQILAARLDHEPLRAWVVGELNGYNDPETLPDYRRLGRVPVLGDYSGVMGRSMSNAPVPPNNVPPELHEKLYTHDVYESVAALEAMVKAGPSAQYPWPAEVVAALQTHFYEQMALVQARKVISSTALAGVLDTVRNRLLAFVIEIEKLDPNAGDLTPGKPPSVSPATVNQVFYGNITGETIAIATAGRGDVSQQVQANVDSARTWQDVSRLLREWGVPDDEIADLDEAIKDDRATEGSSTEIVVGARTKGWLGNLAGKVAGGSVKLVKDIGTDVIAGLLTKAAGG